MPSVTPYMIPRYTIGLIQDHSSVSTPISHCTHSEDIYRILLPLLDHQDREHMYGLFLDSKHAVIGIHHIAMGSIDQAIVHPREVYKCAILLNAACLAIAHNHPSGDLRPSQEDIALTKRLAEAGKILGIALLDHLVFGDDHYYSFADHGLLPQR